MCCYAIDILAWTKATTILPTHKPYVTILWKHTENNNIGLCSPEKLSLFYPLVPHSCSKLVVMRFKIQVVPVPFLREKKVCIQRTQKKCNNHDNHNTTIHVCISSNPKPLYCTQCLSSLSKHGFTFFHTCMVVPIIILNSAIFVRWKPCRNSSSLKRKVPFIRPSLFTFGWVFKWPENWFVEPTEYFAVTTSHSKHMRNMSSSCRLPIWPHNSHTYIIFFTLGR